MSDKNQIGFMHSPIELAKVLIKNYGIHEGYWALITGFGFTIANSGPNPNEIYPTAIIPLRDIGIQPVNKNHPLAINAAKVNPPKKVSSKKVKSSKP